MHLPSFDAATSRWLLELYSRARAQPPILFIDWVFDLLEELVGARYAALNILHDSAVISSQTRGMDRHAMSVDYHQHQLASLDLLTHTMMAQPHQTLAMDADDPRMSSPRFAPMRAFLHKFDMERMAGVALPVPHAACTALLYCNRGRHDAPFTPQQLACLGHVGAHLAEALFINRLCHGVDPHATARPAAHMCTQGWLFFPNEAFARLWHELAKVDASLVHPRVPPTWLHAGEWSLPGAMHAWMVHVAEAEAGFRVELSLARAEAQSRALTQREREVAELYSQGLSYKEVGRRLRIAPNTVRVHIAHCFDKLAVSSRLQLRDQLVTFH